MQFNTSVLNPSVAQPFRAAPRATPAAQPFRAAPRATPVARPFRAAPRATPVAQPFRAAPRLFNTPTGLRYLRPRVGVTIAAIAIWLAPARAQAPAASRDHPSILVSRQLAARAHLSVGDIVTLGSDPAGARRAEFRIVGIYEPTPDPMRFTAARIEA